MGPKEVKSALDKLFSDEGIMIRGFKINSSSPLIANIYHDGGNTHIDFGSNQPKASITKIFTIYAFIEELVFGETGGSVKLRNFPDINFPYEETFNAPSKLNFSAQTIYEKIEDKYNDVTQKEIAKKCLQYAEEWATICHQSGVTFDRADYADRYMLRRQCYNFVKENIEEEAKEKYGSVLLTFFLIYVILPAIIQWVVHRVLDNLFND